MNSFGLLIFLLVGLCAGKQKPGTIKYFDTPYKEIGICDFDTTPNGKEIVYYNLEAATVGYFDIRTRAISEYPIPGAKPAVGLCPEADGYCASVCAIRLGLNGVLYGVNAFSNTIFAIDLAKPPSIRTFQVPNDVSGSHARLSGEATAGPDGMYFSRAEGNEVVFFPYNATGFSYFDFGPGSGPLGLIYGNHNELLVTEFLGNRLAELEPGSGKLTAYALPENSSLPSIMRTKTSHDLFWANAFGSGGLIQIKETKGLQAIKYFQYPGDTNVHPYQNTKDGDGNVWISSTAQNLLAYLDPSTGAWTTFKLGKPLPRRKLGHRRVLPVHYGPDNAMYFTNLRGPQIGRLQL